MRRGTICLRRGGKFLLGGVGGGVPISGFTPPPARRPLALGIFTPDRAANPGVAEAFAGHLACKTYLALTERPAGGPRTERPTGEGRAERPVSEPRTEWAVRNFLGKDTQGPRKGARFRSVRA